MLTLFIFCVAAAMVAAVPTVKNIIGIWYGVEFFPPLYYNTFNISACEPLILSHSRMVFNCDGKPTEAITYTATEGIQVCPVIFVKNSKEALPELTQARHCKETSEKPSVFQVIDDDHFLSYVGVLMDPFSLVRILFTRNITNEADLKAYARTVDDLKDLTGNIVCSSDSNPIPM